MDRIERTIYVSRATARLTDGQLQRILMKSQGNNRRDGVTGMLCAWNGMFAQCLEGTSASVERTLARIEGDPRHTSLEVLTRFEVEDRHFGDWFMHLVDIDRPSPSTDLIRSKYPRLAPSATVFKDPLVAFALLSDLGLIARGGHERRAVCIR